MTDEIKIRRVIRSESNVWNGWMYVNGRAHGSEWKKVWQVTLEFDDKASADQVVQLVQSERAFLSDGASSIILQHIEINT